jgi:hypothetical protein
MRMSRTRKLAFLRNLFPFTLGKRVAKQVIDNFRGTIVIASINVQVVFMNAGGVA